MHVYSFRHNSTLQTLGIRNLFSRLSRPNSFSAPVLKAVELELVLCRLRNPNVTEMDALGKDFDDTDATRIAEALRCEVLCRC